MILGFLIFVTVWLTFFGIILTVLQVRKTKQYRRELGDLYVAAKIKKIAKGDDLDLEVEKACFLDWNKKTRVRENIVENYDDVVEEEMKEQVVDSLTTKSKKEKVVVKSKPKSKKR